MEDLKQRVSAIKRQDADYRTKDEKLILTLTEQNEKLENANRSLTKAADYWEAKEKEVRELADRLGRVIDKARDTLKELGEK
jgi:ABC-type transporter Mla subunit MlaD